MIRLVWPVLRYDVAISMPVTTTSTSRDQHVLARVRVLVGLGVDRQVIGLRDERAAGAGGNDLGARLGDVSALIGHRIPRGG